ncbi:MAG: end-binding protein Ku [Acidimicrobiaceae bacterium]
MARAIWSGSISLGLVNVPVKLHSAVKRKDVHFNQLQESTGARIRYKKVSESSGREVTSDSIVKGYEISKGNYVPVTDEDFEAAEPERTHTIDVEDFIALEEVDPMHYANTYWIAPQDTKGASKAYVLLRDAMDKKGRVAIGRFVLRTKEHLVLIRPVNGALALHTMLFPDEIITANEVDGLPVRVKADPREVRMAEQLIDSLTVKWDPKRYRDTYREKLLDVIKRKAKGEEIVTESREERADVVDLMAALEASIEATKSRRKKSRAKKSA